EGAKGNGGGGGLAKAAGGGRQTRIRRYDQRGDAPVAAPLRVPRRRSSCGQGTIAPQSLAAGSVGTVAPGDADAVEAQILEIQELELNAGSIFRRRKRNRRRSGACCFCGYRVSQAQRLAVA